jgi:hypothetical protein
MLDTPSDAQPPRLLGSRDAALLDRLAERMAQRYPPDVLERFWSSAGVQGAHGGLLGTTLLWAQHTGQSGPLLVAAAWLLLVLALPFALWGRRPDRPRWAHPRALLLPSEVSALEDVLDRTLARGGSTLPRAANGRPLITGADFHRCWRRSMVWRSLARPVR